MKPAPLLVLLVVALAGCVADPPLPERAAEHREAVEPDATSALRPVPSAKLPPLFDDGGDDVVAGTGNDAWESLRTALDRDLRWLRGRPQDRAYTYGPQTVTVAELRRALEEVRAWLEEDPPPTPEALGARIAHRFDAYESVGRNDRIGDDDVLVTGYFEPMIDASPRRRPGYEVPIYGPPRNLVRVDLGQWSREWEGRRIAGILRRGRLVPFPDRSALRTDPILRGKEIAWAADEVDLFFLEVQGSGTLRYPDGRTRRIGYAGSNGRPYRSIGRLLIDRGEIPRERMSMQSLRAWLAANPEEVREVLDYNQSVVFFRRLDGPPVGNLGVPVTPGRTIAVDQRLMPPGALAYLLTERPAPAPDGSTIVEGPLRRFVFAQDTGGAIRGADRADFFWGRGPDAAGRAGVMKQPGRLLFFVPRRGDDEA